MLSTPICLFSNFTFKLKVIKKKNVFKNKDA